jgi:hypothetical protein
LTFAYPLIAACVTPGVLIPQVKNRCQGVQYVGPIALQAVLKIKKNFGIEPLTISFWGHHKIVRNDNFLYLKK